jgi:transposase
VFSDESAFDVAPIRSRFAYRRSGERIGNGHIAQYRPFLKRVMVWGCFNYAGPGPLVPIQGTLCQGGYLDILQNHLCPQMKEWYGRRHHIYQQDNAPCHKAGNVMHFLQQQPFEVMQWPPFSPDLSPIENLWAIIKRRVHREATTSCEELLARVWIIWTEDPEIKEACKSLIEGMPRRVIACIEAKGGPLKY